MRGQWEDLVPTVLTGVLGLLLGMLIVVGAVELAT